MKTSRGCQCGRVWVGVFPGGLGLNEMIFSVLFFFVSFLFLRISCVSSLRRFCLARLFGFPQKIQLFSLLLVYPRVFFRRGLLYFLRR